MRPPHTSFTIEQIEHIEKERERASDELKHANDMGKLSSDHLRNQAIQERKARQAPVDHAH
jgi:hypothetical protein